MTAVALSAWREQAERVVSALTLQEKAALCSGADFWHTKGLKRAGLPPLLFADGPHGLRIQAAVADHMGLNASEPATCFPSGAGLAASWNRELLTEIGAALGREARAKQVGVLLGPAINIKRHPLGGRSFEYFSEDPELAGELAAAYIHGVQSEGVGASVKHFAANNQETDRLRVDAIVDERTLREIYLRAFEIAVTRGQPWTVMSAYNKLNGQYASDNPWLLTQVLRNEWGHQGIVVTDWGAEDDRVAGVRAGTSLEMPGNGDLAEREILAAIHDGALTEVQLNEEAVRLIMLHQAAAQAHARPVSVDMRTHHELARRAATEAAVLLKNDGGLLPLPPERRLAVLGAFADKPRYQGGGSSHLNPTRLDTLIASLTAEHGDFEFVYAPGYDLEEAEPDAVLLGEAAAAAAAADTVVVLVGLTDQEESEGYDRAHLRLSPAHSALVETALTANPNVVVVLSNGSPVEMPWAARTPAILESYLGGQASGSALADILTGITEPGGRLAETFPERLQDTPAFLNWPGNGSRAEYREGLFVGYRHYDALDRAPLFPFGHGLGYADIEITGLRLDRTHATEDDFVTATVTLRNNSRRPGSQVVQLYVHQDGAQPGRPDQELKAFQKVWVEPGHSQDVSLRVDRRAFAWWSENTRAWVVDDALFDIRVGPSSRSITATARVAVHGRGETTSSRGRNTTLAELLEHPVLSKWARRQRDLFLTRHGDPTQGTSEYLLADAFSRQFPLRALLRTEGQISPDELQLVLRVLADEADDDDLAALSSEEMPA